MRWSIFFLINFEKKYIENKIEQIQNNISKVWLILFLINLLF